MTAPNASDVESSAPETLLEALDVLVVDDSTTQSRIIGKMLESIGCGVERAYSKREVNTSPTIMDFEADVVFLDIHLPDGNGLTLVEPLRRRCPKAVIIAMTTNADDGYRGLAEAKEAGVELVLTKPFDIKVLRQALVDARVIKTHGRRGTHVVVLDDSRTACSVIARDLEARGIRVSTFQDAQEAVARINFDHVDVVLTDMLMPGTSGVEVIKLVRDVWPDVGVVAMSAGGAGPDGASTLDEALKYGADTILQKPFPIDKLMLAVEYARRRSVIDEEIIDC